MGTTGNLLYWRVKSETKSAVEKEATDGVYESLVFWE